MRVASTAHPVHVWARLGRIAAVVAVHGLALGVVLQIRPGTPATSAPVPLEVRSLVDVPKPPEPPRPKRPEPPKPQPVTPAPQPVQAPVTPPPPAVLTAAATAGPAPAGFAVAPQPPPAPPLPPAAPQAAAAAVPRIAQPAPPPVPVTAARFDADYLRNPAPEYPAFSKRRREEGRVLLTVRVSAEGTAEQVTLRESSGFGRLDQAAIDTVRQWRFVPARRGTEPMADTVIVPLRFEIK